MTTRSLHEELMRSHSFRIEIEGFPAEAAHFFYCSGLGFDIDVISYREGGMNQTTKQLAGQMSFHPVTLTSGLTKSRILFDWAISGQQWPPQRRSISIAMLDAKGAAEVMRYNLEQCWVSSMRHATLDANISGVAIETITLRYEDLTRS